MADEKIRRENFKHGTITDNPLTSGASTINSAEFAGLATLAADEHKIIVLDPLAVAGDPEIVLVTAHAAASTAITATRGHDGTTARQHASGTAWVEAVTVAQHKMGAVAFATRASTSLTLNSTTWANLDTALDLVLKAKTNDIVEVHINGLYLGEAVSAFIEASAWDGAALQGAWGSGELTTSTGDGIPSCFATAAVALEVFSGRWMRRVTALDVAAGLLTIRWRYRTGSAANKTLLATAADPLHVIAVNHGPQQSTQ